MECELKELYLSNDFGILDDEDGLKVQGSTDVIAYLQEEGNIGKYIATAFTFDALEEQHQLHRNSGDFLNGSYFFHKNMLIVESCSYDSLRMIINHLLLEGDFLEVFRKY